MAKVSSIQLGQELRILIEHLKILMGFYQNSALNDLLINLMKNINYYA
jgi:hypothetical protein